MRPRRKETVLPGAVAWSQQRVAEAIAYGDIAIDATAGNGRDTEFLAKIVGKAGHVHAFDIQPGALDKTRARLGDAGFADWTSLHACSHTRMAELLPAEQHGSVAAVMFNLGYLPGGDKTTITRPDATRAALDQACDLIKVDGIITVVVYTGHEGGQEESDAVDAWAQALDQKAWRAVRYTALNQRNAPPHGIAALRLA